jgi:hypothetical protein
VSHSAAFVKWLREKVEAALAEAQKSDDPYAAWQVLDSVSAVLEGRLSMVFGAVVSSHVVAIKRELGPWIAQESALVVSTLENRVLGQLGLASAPMPPAKTGLWSKVSRLFGSAAPPPAPTPQGGPANLDAALEVARRAGTAVVGLLDHPDPRVRAVVARGQSEAARPRLLAVLERETDESVARAIIERLRDRHVVVAASLRESVGRRFPGLKTLLLVGQLQADEGVMRQLATEPSTRLDALRALGQSGATRFAHVRNELLLAALDDANLEIRRAGILGVREWNIFGAVPRLQALARAGETAAFDTLVAFSPSDASHAFDLVLENVRRTPPVLTGLDVIASARRLSKAQLEVLEQVLPLVPAGPMRAAVEARLVRNKPTLGATEDRFAELAAAIDERPDDVNAWLVWSDAVQGAGDVRGEVVALAHANKPVLEVLERALPVLAPQLGEVLERPADILNAMTLHMGLPRKATFRLAEGLTGSQAQVVAAVLGAPLGRFVREVELGLTDEVGDDNDWGPTLEVLVRLGARVRSLLLGAYEYPDDSEISWVRWGDLSAVWSLSHLEALHVRGGDGVIGTIDSSTLRSLTIETGGLSLPVFEAVLSARLPALEALTLWTGDPNYNGESTAREAVALLDWAPTGLTRLGVENCAYTHELIEPFAKHPALKRLKVLSFANGVVRPNEVELLLQHQPAFAHLEVFDLSANLLDDTSVETLSRAFPNAVFDDQREDYGEEEDRYVAVGE